jgi:hypothetical protein
MRLTGWWSGGESNLQQHLHMALIFLISFNILAAEISADNLAFRLDFPGQESVTVW